MKAPLRDRIVLALLCAGMAGTAEGAQGQASQPREETKVAMKFRTSRTIPKHLLASACLKREPDEPQQRITVLRNHDGDIGGYVVQMLILDSGIGYLDCDGGALTSFHIFAPDEEKRAASVIIHELTRQFPEREVLECPKDGPK